ncbi:hypothetical protein H1R20_g16436, partial [Candolleomyces eurysporus]
MANVVHKVARAGFGTGTNALYDRLGSGTGIFTRALLADPEWASNIRELRAFEPSEGMRDEFTKTVQDSRAKVFDGTFDTIGAEDGWADLVVTAQAFHWCPDHDLAAKEFNRVLKPNGVAAFIWNLEDRDAERWSAQVRDLIEQHEQGTPQFRLDLWRRYFERPTYKEHFLAPEEKQWSYHLEATEDIVVDRASSKSYITVLEPEEKAKVQAGIREIVRRGDDLEWIDKENGKFKYPYKTWVVISRKKSE